ncbi:hypothetical protein GCM10023115_09830 [Pontixanthobacter gangjinensis]|uniref:Uncharacterized protein n=1 Tax=Pontixanthobacter gangjinensis TaxID=1028742 RepID=A0A6I4SKC7_9SPHN|nr:DUF6632 domain-containing protein [Pontixanthobacter gangjinensis]MXO56229.1 hypothetical protein [Pontixanthobacter gangjinensis]
MLGKYTYLQVALVVFGAIFCLVYPLALVWPAGWMWHEGPPLANHYYAMILGVYLTLGVCLILAAKNPAEHLSLIRFTIWSSVVHAVIMAVQALGEPMHSGHLLGDVPALLLVAAVLGWLSRGLSAAQSQG